MSGAEFQYNVRALVARALSLLHELTLVIQQIRTSQTKWSYGFGCPCPTSGPSENEGIHEVGFIQARRQGGAWGGCNAMIHANATIATVLSGAGLHKNYPNTICLNKC